jgi:1-acyl-sn-glycerol-3-phosphate acyltransferase
MKRYSRHPERYPLAKRYAKVRSLVIFVFKYLRLDIKVEGIDYLNKREGTALIVSNHLSDLDALALIYLSEKPISYVAKKETAKFPFIGVAIKCLEGVFMDRKDLRQSVEVLSRVEKKMSEGNLSYVIFPEGTRNRNPKSPLLPFHPGSFKLAFRTNAPIIPVAIYGTFRPFQKNLDYKRFPVEITIGKPIDKEQYAGKTTAEIASDVESTIQNQVTADIAYDERFFLEGKEKIPLR